MLRRRSTKYPLSADARAVAGPYSRGILIALGTDVAVSTGRNSPAQRILTPDNREQVGRCHDSVFAGQSPYRSADTGDYVKSLTGLLGTPAVDESPHRQLPMISRITSSLRHILVWLRAILALGVAVL